MDPVYILLLAALITGVVIWRISRSSAARSSGSASGHRHSAAAPGTVPRARYPAKVFRICNNPCRAALKMRDQAFLAAEAPDLPLADCDRACYCRYTSHNDRRTREDRRYPAADIVPNDELLLPDSALEPDDARSGDERRRRSNRR